MESEEKKELNDRICEQVSNKIEEILEENVNRDNVDYLFKLEDIKKDIRNEKYWEEKIMRYRNYSGDYDDSYGRRMRDARGRYMDDSYGRRGVDGTGRGRRYRGDDMMNEMSDNYGRYMEGHSRYGGSNEDSAKSLEYMLQSAYDFMNHIADEASSQEEMELVKKYARKISEI